MRVSCVLAAALILLMSDRDVARAQESVALTLEEAVELALRNNPDYRAQVNDVGAAEWHVRQAYGALLPGASASAGFQYTDEGSVRLGALTGSDLGVGESPASYVSDYSVGFSYRLDGGTFARIGLQRAQLTSAEAQVHASAVDLATRVRSQYVAALREQDAVDLARREVELARENLRLAQARADIGVTTSLEAMQAEVELGRARVALLTAENDFVIAQLGLLTLMGVEPEREVELVSEFRVFEPGWDAERLIQDAMREHPALTALQAQRQAGAANVRAATMTYLPSLDFSAGWSGYTREISDEGSLITAQQTQIRAQRQQCLAGNEILSRLDPPLPQQDCSIYQFTDEHASRIREANDVFPFDYADQPFTARAQISLPIFQGFQRQARIQEAKVAEDDARYALRARELSLRSNVITSLRTLETAYQAVQLEERNVELAEEQLELARERYRLGAISFIELAEATTLKARADRAHLASIYAFHQALSALEAAVGHDLDQAGEAQ